MNANEAALPNATDGLDRLRRYPPAQPPALCEALAQLYGCASDQLLVGRGSDEAVDLLVRVTCAPGKDVVLVTPPTFGMYGVCARLHGAQIIEAPLQDYGDRWTLDAQAVIDAAIATDAKLVFLCSPGNPTGGVIARDALLAVLDALRGRALVVVDEAYIEFATTASAIELVDVYAGLTILRTLSKAHALAGLRIGCVIAQAGFIAALRRCQAPYPVPEPCARLALSALQSPALVATRAAIALTVEARETMCRSLNACAGIRSVYRSDANFVLVRFNNVDAIYTGLLDAGVVVRDMRAFCGLGDALRISIGTAAQNSLVLSVIEGQPR
ncbi:MAG TPA: histidinol-phosphate transaminase [Xanthomonadaceae bacterium]|nr:histidinol-phosphate transaminase [Xanthomonadaceae bacterium]